MSYLHNHEVLSSPDIDEVRAFVRSSYSPHDFALREDNGGFAARFAGAQCGDLQFVHVTFGDVDIGVKSPEENPDGLLFYMLTGGAGTLRHGAKEMDVSLNRGFVRDLAISVDARQKNLGTFMIPVSKVRLKAHARALAGEHVDLLGLQFEPGIDFAAPAGAMVRNTIGFIAEAMDGPLHDVGSPFLNTQLEDLLLTQLLTLLPNSYQHLVTGRRVATVVPYNVKCARDFIHAHASQTIGLADLVAAAGCSYRALQRGFMDAYGLSPMAYLRSVRLRRIRSVLLSEPDPGPINKIAFAWGFAHAGRFAQAYYRAFGEFPSETLNNRS